MIGDIAVAYGKARQRLLLLDYDGTLAPFAPTPEQAAPTTGLKELLRRLTKDKHNTVVIISGRDHRTLQEWLGDLPLDFAAEHGLFIRQYSVWQTVANADESWKSDILPLLLNAQARTPGSLLEETAGTLNWHYRKAASQKQAQQVAESLQRRLLTRAEESKLTVLAGNKVVVIKRADTDKGIVAGHWLREKRWDFILAAGDDTTDEFMFRAMPKTAFTIKIGDGATVANYHLQNVQAMQKMLRAFTATIPSQEA